MLLKPKKLRRGDKVATISLSWGGAGDKSLQWRYEQGKARLTEVFGLEVTEMPNTLAGTAFLYEHPELRAKDLMDAFKNADIKAIFTCIGGDESIRILPYLDFDVIRKHPKIFIGYSDTTITHLICLKAGVTSFYGPSVLAEFAENKQMHPYTQQYVEKALFRSEPIGRVLAPKEWTSEYLPWVIENKTIQRKLKPNGEFEFLQGSGVVCGHLIGGCMDVLEMAKGSVIWPSMEMWSGGIVFFETSEDTPNPKLFEYWLRSYGTLGILQQAKALLFAKPYDECYIIEYKEIILKIVVDELNLTELPIVYNMSFGHTAPMITIPYGVRAQINCEEQTFDILESGVIA